MRGRPLLSGSNAAEQAGPDLREEENEKQKRISAFSKLTKCSDSICKYLGITLLPQAGVALGMSVTVMELDKISGTNIGSLIRNIILFSVLIYELVGPLMTKLALKAAGEIQPEGKKNARNEENKMLKERKIEGK